MLDQVITLCQRISGRMEEADNEAVWFKLLDSLVGPLNELKGVGDAKPVSSDPQLSMRRLRDLSRRTWDATLPGL